MWNYIDLISINFFFLYEAPGSKKMMRAFINGAVSKGGDYRSIPATLEANSHSQVTNTESRTEIIYVLLTQTQFITIYDMYCINE